MSALTAALAVFDASANNDSHIVAPCITNAASPSASSSALPSLSSSPSASSSNLSLLSVEEDTTNAQPALSLAIAQIVKEQQFQQLRPNEHMAVLSPQRLWKPDSLAKHCDNFQCHVQFSTFAIPRNRKHHCRKCGGVFCGNCTKRRTTLLDASNLPFLHPPKNTAISQYHSSESPVVEARVCDDCWDQIHGHPSVTSSPRTPDLMPSRPSTPSSSASSCSFGSGSILRPQTLRARSIQGQHRSLPSIITTVEDVDKSYGELDAYPLKRASALCKALGGGRWTPAPSCPFVSSPSSSSPIELASQTQPLSYAYQFAPYLDEEEAGDYAPYSTISHVPGTKPRFERDMEREQEAEKRRASNPVVRDGDFQYRLGFGVVGHTECQVRPERRASTF